MQIWGGFEYKTWGANPCPNQLQMGIYMCKYNGKAKIFLFGTGTNDTADIILDFSNISWWSMELLPTIPIG